MLKLSQLINEPKISIIITFYNHGRYIQDCIFSVLNQEYENFEIIIVNDNSDKNNTEILNKIVAKSAKIINLNKNKGQLGAFLEGLKVASGEFVCLVNPDDILLPNYLKTLQEVFLIKNVAFVSSCGVEVNKKDEFMSLNYKNNQISKLADRFFYKRIEKLYNNDKKICIKHLNLRSLPFAQWGWNSNSCVMIKKDALDILEYYPDIDFFKTQAYRVILPLLHLIGTSADISVVSHLYRHNSNSSDDVRNYIWDNKVRSDCIAMLINNKEKFIEKYSKANYLKMCFRVIFSINIKTYAKIIKKLLRMN